MTARAARRGPRARRSGQAGYAARYPDHCPRCPRPITPGDRVVPHRDGVIHVGCASGQDDE